MKKILSTLIVFLVSYSLFACSSKQKQLDIFKDSSCDLPCWNGIIVGHTTLEELLLILDNLSVVNKDTVGVILASGVFESRVSFSIGEKDNDGQYPGSAFAFIKDSKVSSMAFVGRFELTVDETINIFGAPKNVFSRYKHNGDIYVDLLMPVGGAIALLSKAENDAFISGNDPVISLEIIDLALYDSVIQSTYTFDGHLIDFYSWDGFGNIYDKYPPQ
jgi:hypothetical protein